MNEAKFSNVIMYAFVAIIGAIATWGLSRSSVVNDEVVDLRVKTGVLEARLVAADIENQRRFSEISDSIRVVNVKLDHIAQKLESSIKSSP